jgi:cellulose synthase/poly-beta-1,6-N-acetylglucosamine synthase-like glycosyltransferase
MNMDPAMIREYVESASFIVATTIIGITTAQNILYFIQLIVAFIALQGRLLIKTPKQAWQMLRDSTMPISMLVPAYNEETTIVENIRSMLALHYPNFEVVVINDGSKDGTLETAIEAFELKPIERPFEMTVPHQSIRGLYGSKSFPNLILVDKENGGKSDALNAGINHSRFPLFCAVDADSLLESDALLRAVQPFAEDPDRVIAVGGTIRIANGCTVRAGRVENIDLPSNTLALFQIVEYLRAFLMARMAWSHFNALMLVSGAFGIFKRSTAVIVGGYDANTVGEDLELIVKLHRHMRETKQDYDIKFIPDPVCWTEAPENLRELARQRMRWQRGALETFFKHIRMLGNPRYGAPGLIGYPHIFLIDVLGPPTELLGYLLMPAFWYLGVIQWEILAAFLALTFIFGIFVSVGSLVLEELELKRYPKASHLLLLLGAAVLENFGYRQINSLWRIAGFWQYITGAKTSWGEMTRQGFKRS